LYEPDPDVIRAAGAGDTGAFEELVRGYQAHVWRFLRHLLGDPELAEDITQETFIRVYRKLGTFRFRSKFSTWIFQVARHAGIDALRSRQRQERLHSAMEAHTPGPVSGGDLRVEIEAALQSLSPKLREAFVLIEALGLTYREAGRAIGVPEGTVKSRVFHAREQLVTWMTVMEGVADDA
jgi:RNA polymerase sigma-70 factor, ECF subfamily